MEKHPLANSTHLGNGEQSATHATLVDAPKRDWRFWFSFLAICISVFIAALELVRDFQPSLSSYFWELKPHYRQEYPPLYR